MESCGVDERDPAQVDHRTTGTFDRGDKLTCVVHVDLSVDRDQLPTVRWLLVGSLIGARAHFHQGYPGV